MKRSKLFRGIALVLVIALMIPMAATAVSPTIPAPTPAPTTPPSTSGTTSSPVFQITGYDTAGSTLPANTTLQAAPPTAAEYTAFTAAAMSKGAKGTALGIFDFTLYDANGNVTQPDNKTVIKMVVPAMKPGDIVMAFHYHLDANGNWVMEQVPATAFNGYFLFAPKGFSLYGFYVQRLATTTTTTTPVSSPNTGIA